MLKDYFFKLSLFVNFWQTLLIFDLLWFHSEKNFKRRNLFLGRRGKETNAIYTATAAAAAAG